jgi:hypothetical protein
LPRLKVPAGKSTSGISTRDTFDGSSLVSASCAGPALSRRPRPAGTGPALPVSNKRLKARTRESSPARSPGPLDTAGGRPGTSRQRRRTRLRWPSRLESTRRRPGRRRPRSRRKAEGKWRRNRNRAAVSSPPRTAAGRSH